MEIKLQCGDKITIPEGCKAIVKDRSVVFEKEENKEEFKRGDVIVSKVNEILLVDMHSFEKRFSRSFVNIKDDGSFCKSSYSQWNELHAWRYATEEEKQLLFDKMKEQGLHWNAEKKRVENIRWRAEDGKEYYYVGNQGILMVDKEDGVYTDKNRYEFSNYFRIIEQAKEAARRVREALRQYHDEIGE